MKSIKDKITTLIFTIIIAVGALCFGVYAAFNVTHTSSGSITFDTLEADVDLDIIVTGAKVNPPKFVGTSNTTRQPGKTLITSSIWDFGSLTFDDINAVSPSELEIRFEMTIYNYSRFPIEANVTLPTITGLTITKQDIEYSYSYDSNLGADERRLIVSIVPIKEDVQSANLSFTLNVLKTLKKETEISKFKWGTPTDGKISLLGNTLTLEDTKIIIPRKNGDNSVTIIGSRAFYQCSLLTSVTIPNSLSAIGAEAFEECSALTSMIIQKGVTIIAWRAFFQCSLLNSVIIPNSVTNIDDEAFSGCYSLTRIAIPANVSRIGWKSFYGCSSLTAIDVDLENANFSSDNGVLLNKAKTKIIQCPGKKTSYIIPASVTSIENDSFYRCSSITSMTIPNNVTSIGSNAFQYCTSLSSVIIQEGITSIGTSAFQSCALISVTIPNSVTSIGTSAFSNCSALASVYFERTSVFSNLSSNCFANLKSGSVLYFKNQTIMDQFTTSYYTSSKTTKALY